MEFTISERLKGSCFCGHYASSIQRYSFPALGVFLAWSSRNTRYMYDKNTFLMLVLYYRNYTCFLNFSGRLLRSCSTGVMYLPFSKLLITLPYNYNIYHMLFFRWSLQTSSTTIHSRLDPDINRTGSRMLV